MREFLCILCRQQATLTTKKLHYLGSALPVYAGITCRSPDDLTERQLTAFFDFATQGLVMFQMVSCFWPIQGLACRRTNRTSSLSLTFSELFLLVSHC
jgi:hypothetical protein